LWRRGKLKPIIYDNDPFKQLIKVVFNGRGEGGAERSICWIMSQFIKRNWRVQYISPNEYPCGTFKRNPIDGVEFRGKELNLIKEDCDLLLLYTNDWIWEFPKLGEIFSFMKAKRKVMAVNYKAGKIADLNWCQGWDHYLFLNSTLKEQTKQNGTVMAPPTDLSIYFNNEPDYSGNLRIVRHSSQGDTKYPKTLVNESGDIIEIGFNQMLSRILEEIPDSEIFLMPAPSFLAKHHLESNRVHVHNRNIPPVNEFLAQGNCFWYALPGGGYSEGGPKVIMEAQASGLPIVADNHSGAVDRLRYSSGLCGFLCDNFEVHLKALKELANDIELRKVMGNNARIHAKKMYNPQDWIDQIISGFPMRLTQLSDLPFTIGPVREIDK